MLLAYVFRIGNEARPELCLVASKPDAYSVPVDVFQLPVTESAVVRMSHSEAILMRIDPSDNGRIITPVKPSKLFLTPSQPDRLGEQVVNAKIFKHPEGDYSVYYQREADAQKNNWKQWTPNAEAQGQ